NTFEASRLHLAEQYAEADLEDINLTGARLAVEARNASGRPVLVAGSMGPLGRPIEPIGGIKRTSAERMFREQVAPLQAGGVDLLLLETFSSLDELNLAVGVARQLAPDLPIAASMRIADGEEAVLDAFWEAMRRQGVTLVGVNCGVGPGAIGGFARRLVAAGASSVLAMPNAGLPERQGGRLVYASGAEYFGSVAPDLFGAGVQAVGGCCGTRPLHIAALRAAIRRPLPVTQPIARAARPVEAAGVSAPSPQSHLARRLGDGAFVFSVEMTPPRGFDSRRLLRGARQLRDAGIEFVNVPESAMARLRMSAVTCATLIQQQAGLEAIAHFTTRDRNVMAIQSELIGAHALGIRNVLCMRGDPPRVGDFPNAHTVWEVSATGLITIVRGLNQGRDANGAHVGTGAGFFAGAAFNPAAENYEREVRLLRRKVEAGARFVVANAAFDRGIWLRMREVLAPLGVPVIAGIMPLASIRQVTYLRNEVPGIVIPDRVARRIEDAGDRAEEAGLDHASELLEGAQELVQGAYIIPSVGRYDLAAALVQRGRRLVA
ncbi:MAG: bifunctional homocysteine S-methyltransferase/methylenetetrahydrofolate reductase, partial [Candidatus Dormibacteraceae bacterium]